MGLIFMIAGLKTRALCILMVASSIMACSNGTQFGLGSQQAQFDSTIKYNNKVDIVWVVDDSSSMRQHQAKLSLEVSDMVNQLNQLGMDYRMVVTTTSIGNGFGGGRYVGSPQILTSGTPGLVSQLQSRLIPGEMGADREQGILSLQNLLNPSYLEGAGQGFHREESLLLINILSDEDDQTDGTAASVVQSLRNRLDQFKRPFRPNVGGWLVNFIGVKDNTCRNGLGQSPIGYRYLDLVIASQGQSFSICQNSLKEAVSRLQARVLEIITDYPLASVPNLDTVRVYQNGVPVPRSTTNGWDYIPSLRVIRFYGGFIPSSRMDVKVDYTPATAS
jgi:hypothetical protein